MKKKFKILWLLVFSTCLVSFININKYYEEYEEFKDINTTVTRKAGCICSLDNNLPIIIIDTKGQNIGTIPEYKETYINDLSIFLYNKSEKYNANLKLYEPEGGYTCICEKSTANIDSNILINVRGQSSLQNPKKQYTISFKDENGEENHLEILGLPKHDKWVLNASYGDKSLIRNHLAYQMAQQVMEYAPSTKFVEVYLNDKSDKEISYANNYIGVYILTEKIEKGEDRVDILKNENKYNDISFIISRDKIKAGDPILETSWSKLEDDYIMNDYGLIKMRTVITTTYPGQSILTEEYKERIIDYINEFEYVLKSNYFNNRKNGYRKYIDIDSFINFAMINEIFKNIDGGDVSTYFYKDIGGLMKAGPVWDFDLSLGNSLNNEDNSPAGFKMINTIWFDRLFQDEYFANRYKDILYPYYRSTIWTNRKIENMIDNAVKELGPAVKRNSDRWYLNYTEENYQKEIEDIKTFFNNRFSWMDNNIHLIKRILENPE